ncbi:MAG: hypothetical protein ABI480_04825, partial [Chitinophagaceae bacterium]
FKHVFLTWLIANLLHLIVWFCWSLIGSDGEVGIVLYNEWYRMLVVLAAIVSLPCLLIVWFFLGFIISAPYTVNGRFFLWMLTVIIVIVIAAICVLQVYKIGMDGLVFALPAAVATMISITIRYKQFQNLIDSTQPYEF